MILVLAGSIPVIHPMVRPGSRRNQDAVNVPLRLRGFESLPNHMIRKKQGDVVDYLHDAEWIY